MLSSAEIIQETTTSSSISLPSPVPNASKLGILPKPCILPRYEARVLMKIPAEGLEPLAEKEKGTSPPGREVGTVAPWRPTGAEGEERVPWL
jgi:hypothetical protein